MIRRLKITNTYPDGTVVAEESVDIPADADEDWLQDELFQYTGTGRDSSVPAYYEIESIDGLEPEIRMEWN